MSISRFAGLEAAQGGSRKGAEHAEGAPQESHYGDRKVSSHRHVCEASGHHNRHCETSTALTRHCEASEGCRSNPDNPHKPTRNAPRHNARRRASRNARHGLSLLEFTLIVILIGVLMVFAMQRMVELRVQIERAAVERTVNAMQAGLALQFAELAVQGELERAREWEGSNPLELIEGRAIFDADEITDATRIGPGTWSWDEAGGEVVYRVRYADALDGDDPQGRWRVVATSGTENAGATPTGLTLEQTRAIDWP